MTKRPWHEQMAALFPCSWWLAFVFGAGIGGPAAATLVRTTFGDDSVRGSDVAWALVGLAGGMWWLAIAYAKRRDRRQVADRA